MALLSQDAPTTGCCSNVHQKDNYLAFTMWVTTTGTSHPAANIHQGSCYKIISINTMMFIYARKWPLLSIDIRIQTRYIFYLCYTIWNYLQAKVGCRCTQLMYHGHWIWCYTVQVKVESLHCIFEVEKIQMLYGLSSKDIRYITAKLTNLFVVHTDLLLVHICAIDVCILHLRVPD